MFNVSDLNPEKLKVAFPSETIKIDGVPYLTRYYITGKNDRKIGEGRSIFLHQFHTSDQGRELHNHPYEGTSYILKGGYWEERFYKNEDGTFSPVTRTFYAPGDTNVLPLNAFHRTDLNDEGEECWTLFITGDRVKSWGFINRETKQFFEYMDKNEARLGSGPHARDEIDGSIASRRAQLDVRMSRGEFAVGDSVDFTLWGEPTSGVVLEVFENGNLFVGDKNGYKTVRRPADLKHSVVVFNVAAGASESDNYGCPDKSWLKNYEQPVLVQQATTLGDIVEVHYTAEQLGGQVAKVGKLFETTALVGAEDGKSAVLDLALLTKSDKPFALISEDKVDQLGCPDRSWLATAQAVEAKDGEDWGSTEYGTDEDDYSDDEDESDYDDGDDDYDGSDEDERFETARKLGDKVLTMGKVGVIVAIDHKDTDLPFRVTFDDGDSYGEWRSNEEVLDAPADAVVPAAAFISGSRVKLVSDFLGRESYVGRTGTVLWANGYGAYRVRLSNKRLVTVQASALQAV